MKAQIESRWLLLALVGVAVVCVLFIASKSAPPVNAQAKIQTTAENGILAFPVQIERDTYGLAMVDTASQTLWIYELSSRGPVHSRLKLLAARSWRYDRLLQQYNTSEPKPQQVKALLQHLDQQQKKHIATEGNILEIAEPNNKKEGSKSGKK